MKIDEIVSIESRDTSLSEYDQYFKNAAKEPVSIVGSVVSTLCYSTCSVAIGDEYFAILDSDAVVSLLKIEFSRLNKAQIELTQTDYRFRKQGLLRYLLGKAIDKYAVVYSDTHQTVDARLFWESLMRFPGDFQITATNVISQDEVPVSTAWDGTEDVLLAVSYRTISEDTLRRRNIREQKIYTNK